MVFYASETLYCPECKMAMMPRWEGMNLFHVHPNFLPCNVSGKKFYAKRVELQEIEEIKTCQS